MPLYDEPFVPYQVSDMPTICVFCRAAPGVIEKYLKPTPFEFVNSDFVVSAADMMNTGHSTGGFYDVALVVQVKYKGQQYGYYLFEYEQDDYCVAAGRELWGYPKKMATGSLIKKDGKIIANAVRNGVQIIRMEMDPEKPPQRDIPKLITSPHLNIQIMPNCDGPGVFSKRILRRDTSPDFVRKSKTLGEGKIAFKSTHNNPIGEFTPVEVYGATYEIGDFFATPENGWAKVLETLV
jgi:acetoacetate decarboxylase